MRYFDLPKGDMGLKRLRNTGCGLVNKEPIYPPAWANKNSDNYTKLFFKNGTSGNEWHWWLLRKTKSCKRCYMRVSRWWCRGGDRESGQSLADSHGWRDEAESLERPQCLVFPGKEPDEKAAHRENSGDLLQYFLMDVYKENHLRPGKEPSERIRETRAWCLHRAGDSTFPLFSLENLILHGELGRVHRRILFQYWEICSPKLKVVWSWLKYVKCKNQKNKLFPGT